MGSVHDTDRNIADKSESVTQASLFSILIEYIIVWLTNNTRCSNTSTALEPAYNTMANMSEPAAEVPWVQFTIPNATCEDRVEEIYEDLCYVKFTSNVPEVTWVFVRRLGGAVLYV